MLRKFGYAGWLRGAVQKILQHLMAMFCEDRLRVELHAFDLQRPVTNTHNFIDLSARILRPGSGLQTVRQAFVVHSKGVVTGCLHLVR